MMIYIDINIIQNINKDDIINILKNEIKDLNKKNNQLIDENQKLKKDIENYKKNEIDLQNKINQYKNDIQNKNIELINNKNENLIFDNINNKNTIMSLLEKIEIKNIKTKLMPIIFRWEDESFFYSIICEKDDKFNQIENLLYEKYPYYLEEENYFTINGKK